MLRQLQSTVVQAALSAGYLFFFLVAAAEEDWLLQRGALAIVAVAGAIAAWTAFKRYHLISDTPTAQIASAAQGYVELFGRSGLLLGASSLSFANSPPCVWYRYKVTRQNGDRYETVDSGQSHETFLLKDTSGECVIDPDLAEIITQHKNTIRNGSYKTVVEFLTPGESLYVIGSLKTLGGAGIMLDRRSDIRELLGEWKRDTNHLLERFDRNADGQIDEQEWEHARKAAAKEVAEEHAKLRLTPDTHIMRAPEDGRPFIISNRDPLSLAKRFRLWAIAHTTAFTVAFAWLGKLLLG